MSREIERALGLTEQTPDDMPEQPPVSSVDWKAVGEWIIEQLEADTYEDVVRWGIDVNDVEAVKQFMDELIEKLGSVGM